METLGNAGLNANGRGVPPDNVSIRASVELQWKGILELWKGGWHSESSVERLENYIEHHRVRIFDDKSAGDEYDWEADWIAAVNIHDRNSDFVRNRRTHNEDLKRMWFEWHERNANSLSDLSLEALRGMILINGATILACLTLLSGQINKPNPSAVLGARVMLICSIISLFMMAAGHLIGYIRAADVGSKVRGVLVGHTRHSRLYAINRYLRRNLNPVLDLSNGLIYGSIFVFAASALIAAIILTFGVYG